MTTIINYDKINLVPYNGVGNNTPVLDLTENLYSDVNDPAEIRQRLETDLHFRKILQQKSKTYQADSIMVYYQANNQQDYQYVMFVAEPNTSITIPFSEMCGNGIRSLGLHLFLESDDNHRDIYLTEGINIWTAAGVLKVQFKTIDTVNHQAIVEVKLGQFKFEMKNLFNFVSSGYFDNTNLTAINLNDYIDLPVNFSNRFGIGFTGEDNGEPHLALILNQTEFYDLIAKLRINNNDDLMALLRKTVSYLGNYFTFNYELFPHGINFNLGIIKNDKIFMSTHERNLVASKELCQYQYHRDGLCKCNTKACGTGGAVVANLTWLNYRFLGRQISTIHPGGEIVYQQKFNDTFMSGLTKKIC